MLPSNLQDSKYPEFISFHSFLFQLIYFMWVLISCLCNLLQLPFPNPFSGIFLMNQSCSIFLECGLSSVFVICRSESSFQEYLLNYNFTTPPISCALFFQNSDYLYVVYIYHFLSYNFIFLFFFISILKFSQPCSLCSWLYVYPDLFYFLLSLMRNSLL